ncbi:MAG: acetyl-CoA carboxylase biotin carboxylase subunit [Candidatus Marinimicrobia bacterium]|nr:acetyl-CoA carboxylase biotin carboxylase subunit [Candidatus Neomarinimicrobiota bacterium]
MINKILIANRGEIALRIIRACKEMGIKTVAVYSEADELSLHTRFADEAVCIGPPLSSKSYLNIPSIISAAELTNSDAIHPGYGFLSENSEFANICIENNITFIGPDSKTIDLMGDKSQARKTVEALGLSIIPGSKDIIQNIEECKEVARNIGYPVMIKASSGGGGKGMRIVKKEDELESSLSSAQAEAKASFNDNRVYLEKFIEEPRHIEIQIISDSHGNTISLGERECSIQRRNQKIIEEAPSVVVNEELRAKMSDSAIKIAKSVNYLGVGTVEFLLDKYNNFYFMEMNTRVQVEHPVTELISGVDIIKTQIRCHDNFMLPNWMHKLKPRGHSIECRINAEDPYKDFMPSPGKILSLHLPSGMGVRTDTHIYVDYEIPPYYDSMICKLIVHAANRKEAIKKMRSALDEFVIEGVKTIIPYQKFILDNERFIEGNFSTNFLNELNTIEE